MNASGVVGVVLAFLILVGVASLGSDCYHRSQLKSHTFDVQYAQKIKVTTCRIDFVQLDGRPGFILVSPGSTVRYDTRLGFGEPLRIEQWKTPEGHWHYTIHIPEGYNVYN